MRYLVAYFDSEDRQVHLSRHGLEVLLLCSPVRDLRLYASRPDWGLDAAHAGVAAAAAAAAVLELELLAEPEAPGVELPTPAPAPSLFAPFLP